MGAIDDLLDQVSAAVEKSPPRASEGRSAVDSLLDSIAPSPEPEIGLLPAHRQVTVTKAKPTSAIDDLLDQMSPERKSQEAWDWYRKTAKDLLFGPEHYELPRDADGSVNWDQAVVDLVQNIHTRPANIAAGLGQLIAETIPAGLKGALNRALETVGPGPATVAEAAEYPDTGPVPRSPLPASTTNVAPQEPISEPTIGPRTGPMQPGPKIVAAGQPDREDDIKAIHEAGVGLLGLLPPVMLAQVLNKAAGSLDPRPIEAASKGANWAELKEKYPEWAREIEDLWGGEILDVALIAAGAPKIIKGTAGMLGIREGMRPDVSRGTFDGGEIAKPNVSRQIHEDVAEVAPLESPPTASRQLPELRGSLSAEGEAEPGAVSGLRQPPKSNAPSELPVSTPGDLAVSRTPSGMARGERIGPVSAVDAMLDRVEPAGTIIETGPGFGAKSVPEPAAPTGVTPPEEPGTVGIRRADIGETLKEFGWEKLTKPVRQSFEAWHREAIDKGLVDQVEDLARQAVQEERALTPVEHAAAVQRLAEMRREFRSEGGVTPEALERLHAFEEDIATTGSTLGRAFVSKKMRVDVETGELAATLQEARTNKGSALTREEIEPFKSRDAQIQDLLDRIEEERARADEVAAQRDKAIAEKVALLERGKVARTERTATVKAKISTEIASLEKKLAALGNRMNSVVGPPADAMYLVGKLAAAHIRRGAVSLDEVVRTIRDKFPDFTDRDVWEAMNARSPEAQIKARGRVESQLGQLKRQAKLLTAIDDAQQGVVKARTAPKPQTAVPEAIRVLQQRLAELRTGLWDSPLPADKLERAIQRIDRLADQLDNDYRVIRKAKPGEPTPDMAHVTEIRRDLERQIHAKDVKYDLEEQLRTGDFKPTTKPRPYVSPELERLQIQVRRVRQMQRQGAAEMKRTTAGRVASEAYETIRTGKATGDLSFNFRQNIIPALSHPIMTGSAAAKAVAGTFSKYRAEQLMNSLHNSENWDAYGRSGIEIHELDSHVPGLREEVFYGSLLERIPVIREFVGGANRDMTLTGNLSRAGMIDNFVRNNPNATTPELKAYGHWANIATGIGDVAWMGKAAGVVGRLIFAPKLAASRIQAPIKFYNAITGTGEYRGLPRVRKQVAMDMTRFVATGMAVLAVADIALKDQPNAGVSANPSDPDFGKIRIGKTSVDIWGGFQQPARVIAQIGAGAGERVGLWDLSGAPIDPLALLGRFSSFKIAPQPALALELYRGKTMVGEKRTVTETMAHAAMPLFIEDIADAWNIEGRERAAWVAPLTITGVSVSTYERKKKRRPR